MQLQIEKRKDDLPSSYLFAEANLLRLPLFYLETKRLAGLDGIEVEGDVTFDGNRQMFTYRAYRSTGTIYPGTLSRCAHQAFLSIITESGFPFKNPVTWTWRDLCRRMDVSQGGQMIERIKQAIMCTKGLLIQTKGGIYSKREKKSLFTTAGGINFYDKVSFQKCQDGSGRVAEQNEVWLADWYLNNLNDFYTASLDYDLWKTLDAKSSMASRLYEYFLNRFYNGMDCFTINYPTLVKFIPATRNKSLSKARQQLDPIFRVLKAVRVIDGITWEKNKKDVAQLQIYRGPMLPSTNKGGQVMTIDQVEVNFEVRELRNVKPPEWDMVTTFYKTWTGDTMSSPTTKELAMAHELIETHGEDKVKAALPAAINLLRKAWPGAKTFQALIKYIPEALGFANKQVQAKQSHEDQQKKLREERAAHEEELRKEKEFKAQWTPIWDALPEEKKEEVRQKVLRTSPLLVGRQTLMEIFCLRELAAIHEKTTESRPTPRRLPKPQPVEPRMLF